MLAGGGGDMRLASAWLLVGDFWASYRHTYTTLTITYSILINE